MINHKNPRIFIVEDDPAYRKLVENYVKSSGQKNIISFSSGEACVEHLEQEKPDIVLQDFDLEGGMNGLESMKSVKKIHPDCEYIFLSGQSSIEVAVETIKEGAFDYIIKDNVAKQNVAHKIKKIIAYYKLLSERDNSRIAVRLISSGFFILLIGIFLYWYFVVSKI